MNRIAAPPCLARWSLMVAAALSMPAVARADAPADPDARARQIVSQMTLDEKVAQLHGTVDKHTNRIVLGLPRLGIPSLTITNGPAGMGPAGPGHDGKATALPAPISLAATWDVAAAAAAGDVAAVEAADLGNRLLESPDINIARTPHNGRTFESFGEDPFLSGELAVANVVAIQHHGVVANVKHFAGNNQEDHRLTIDDDIDERTLREIYLPAFEAAIVRGGCGSIMGAYNRLNGAYCCENDVLLNRILKGDWRFDGFVTSDFGAVHTTVACAAFGLDLELPSGAYWGEHLRMAVRSGLVQESALDEKLVRRFRTMMRLGAWDRTATSRPIDAKVGGVAARRTAAEGTVLLKNDGGLLPLGNVRSIALIGPSAARAMTGGGGSSHVEPLYTVTPADGLRERYPGITVTVDDGKDVARAVAAAKGADVVLLMLGDHQTEGVDHPITLAKGLDDLATAVLAANPRTVVILKTGGPVLMPWADHAAAILELWYPGEEEGHALADVLSGDADPSGRLPITFPKTDTDGPLQTPAQYPGVDGVAHYSEGLLVGYRWYDANGIAPLFPFGHGLSYTTFGYRNLIATPTAVEFDLTNTGQRPGVEVAQLYLEVPTPDGVTHVLRQLKGFARQELPAGATAHVRLPLDARSASYWDVTSHGWKVHPGAVRISVGHSSRDIRLTGEFESH